MINIQLFGNTLHVCDNNRRVFDVCENGLERVLNEHKLTILDRITKKRAIKIVNGTDEFSLTQRRIYVAMLENEPRKVMALTGDGDDVTREIKRLGLVDVCRTVYENLRERDLHPSGEFDKAGRWYATNRELVGCRAPSRAWPYSEMNHCRTLKYVKRCALYFNCKTIDDLLAVV
jgi:hypothetical protein